MEPIKNDENKINKYHNGKIYKIVNDIDDKVYIGSTCQPLYKRLFEHKLRVKHDKNRQLYKHYNDIGVEQMKIILVEEYKCNNKMELLKKEREYIENIDQSIRLNRTIPTRDKTEWTHCNKDKVKTTQEKYRNNHKEKIKDKRMDNKDKKKEYDKIYYENKKQVISDKLKNKIICSCGMEIKISNKSQHLKTKKHINSIAIKL